MGEGIGDIGADCQVKIRLTFDGIVKHAPQNVLWIKKTGQQIGHAKSEKERKTVKKS